MERIERSTNPIEQRIIRLQSGYASKKMVEKFDWKRASFSAIVIVAILVVSMIYEFHWFLAIVIMVFGFTL